MNEPPEHLENLLRWIEKAENDLRNGEYVLTLKDDCPYDTVCYHSQQCAEKYLKALLIYRGLDFPRTHDLVLLFNLLGGKTGTGMKLKDIQPLNRYSVEARYPGDWDPVDRPEAEAAVKMARIVRAAARDVMSI